MENVNVVTTEAPQAEEVVEVKQEPKKRGRKPKSAAQPAIPQVEDQREPQTDAPTEPVPTEQVEEEPTLPSGVLETEVVTETKPKAKRATRTKKTRIDVVPIQHTLEESNVEVHVQEEPEYVTTKELTPEQQQELLVKLLREQQLNKRSQKQQKYRHLITSAF